MRNSIEIEERINNYQEKRKNRNYCRSAKTAINRLIRELEWVLDEGE